MAKGFVYFIGDGEGLVKIGATSNVPNRLATLQTASPRKLRLIASVESEKPFELESKMHRNFSKQRAQGEWFNLREEEINSIIKELEMGFSLPAYPALIKMLEHFSKVTQRMAESDTDIQDVNNFYGHHELNALERRIGKLESLDRHSYHQKLIVLSETLHYGLFTLYQANGYPPYFDTNLQERSRDLVGLIQAIKTHLLLREQLNLVSHEELAGWFK